MREGVWAEILRGLVSQKAPFTFDIDALWERAVSVRIGGAEAMALSIEDAIHHLAVHRFHHHFAPAPQCGEGEPAHPAPRLQYPVLPS